MESAWSAIQSAWNGLIELLSKFVIPDWGALIALFPVFIGVAVLGFFAWVITRYATAAPRQRGPGKLPPATPEGIHMPGPSLAPLLAALGAFLFFFGLFIGFGTTAFWLGFLALVVTLLYWLREGMRDYDHIDAPTALPTAAHAGPPPGVHMPGPSFQPILISVALVVLFGGLVAGPALLLGGLILVILALGGWLRDAGSEYRAVAEADRTGHLAPSTSPNYPRGVLAAFAIVLVVSVGATAGILPPGGTGASPSPSAGASGSAAPAASAGASGGMNGGMMGGGSAAPGSAAPGGGTAGAAGSGDVNVSAQNVAFDQTDLTAPAGKPFTLAFTNNDDGIPHNVAIKDANGAELFKGEIVNGVTTIVYQVPAIPAGSYTFVCSVHPNMVGTLTVQ